VNLDIPVLGITPLQLDGNQYQEVRLPGGDKLIEGKVASEGEPDIPVLSTFLAIPDQAGVEYTVEYSGIDIIDDIDLAPAQPPTPESEPSEIIFTRNESVYGKDEFYPGTLAEVGEPVIMRDIRMVQVSMYPAQYNPVRRQLKVYRDLNVAVSFNGQDVKNPKTTRFGYLSEGFYPIYRAMVSNFDQFFSTTEVRRGGYLILTKQIFVDSLKALADWKHRKGYTVHIAPTTEIDPNGDAPTQQEVFAYLQNAYNTWDVPPEYIMIVGDESGSYSIPDYPYPYSSPYYASDHKYSMLEGSDFLPDVFVSRLSVASMSQLRITVKKIMAYETDPYMDDPGLWKRGLSVAGNVIATTPRTTVLWVRHLLLENGFTHVDTSFSWSSIPGHPDYNPGPGEILASMNEGVAFVSYRGWAGPSGWYNPSFSTSNLEQVTNHKKIGIMASIVCGTGDFGTGECFGEKWVRMGTSITAYKGGPAFYGCTDPGTSTEWNNPIMTGYYWGMFAEGIYHFAAAAVRGKIQQYNTFPRARGNGGQVEKYFHTYNMLGDPELEVRTKDPILISVSHPQSVHFGENFIEINVTDQTQIPVEGAYVTLLKKILDDDEVFEVEKTDEFGNAVIEYNAANAGDMKLTVSGPNLFPYQSTITITENELAVVRDSAAIDDDNSGYSSGNGDGIANPGEVIELSVYLKNLSPDQTAENIRAQLIPIDGEQVTVLDSVKYYGNIAPGERVMSETPFVIRISPYAADGSEIRSKVIASDNDSSWQSMVGLQVAAPKFIISNVTFPGGNGRLDPGETVDMVLTLQNTGSVDATGVTASASVNDDYTTMITDFGEFGNIPVLFTGDNSASPMVISSDSGTFDGRILNLSLHTLTASGAQSIVPFSVTVGLLQASDPVGPDNYGYYMYDNTDAGYAPQPTYSWVEIVPNLGGQGTRINYGSNFDDNSVMVSTPFDFIYYGEVYNIITVCTNGFISIDTSSYDMGRTLWANFYNWPIPDPGNCRGQISPFWDDLYYSGSTYGVYTWYDTDNNRFIIEWYHMNQRTTGTEETLELVIYDPSFYPTLTGDSEILYQYKTITNNDSGEHYSSVGFEDYDQIRGIQYSYDNFYAGGAATLANSRAIKLTTNTGRGAISGKVDLSNGGFNQGVLVSTATGQHRLTPQSGDFWIKDVPPGTAEVSARIDGYFPATISGVNVAANITTPDVNFALTGCPQPQNLAASEGLGDRIEVTWDVVGHPDLVGYNIFRAAWPNGIYQKLNSDPVGGESFTDVAVPDSGTYWYYVSAVFSGDYGDAESFASNIDSGSLEEPTGIDDNQPSIPAEFFISQNYPNPFNPSTSISYGLPSDADVRIEIFNILGQNVRTLIDERQKAGYRSVVWDGADNSGARVSSGVYFYTIEAGSYRDSRKMLLIK